MVQTEATVNLTQNLLAALREEFLRGSLPGVLRKGWQIPCSPLGKVVLHPEH